MTYGYEDESWDDSWDEVIHDDEVMTPDGPSDMLVSELLDTRGDPWGDADI